MAEAAAKIADEAEYHGDGYKNLEEPCADTFEETCEEYGLSPFV